MGRQREKKKRTWPEGRDKEIEKEQDRGKQRQSSAQGGRDQAWPGKGPQVSGFSQAHVGGLNLSSDPKLRDSCVPQGHRHLYLARVA